MLRPGLSLPLAISIVCTMSLSAHAEEAGTGHYMPGAMASFIDAFPIGKPGFAYLNLFTFYDANAGKGRTLQFGGIAAANVDATAYVDTSVFLYQTPWKLLGNDFGVGVVVPYYWMEVEADATIRNRTVATRDTANGFGDLMFLPVMLGAQRGDLKYAFTLGVYAPTGEYDKGHLANVGKNYWTVEPVASVSYLSHKIGLELTGFVGADLNTTNDKTDYHTGEQFHADVTVAQHLPLGGGFAGVGANTFYYQQVGSDSGDGARLGRFQGRTIGIGPVLSYATKIHGIEVVAEAKWLPELEVENRLEGDIVWAKLAVVF